MSDNISTAAGMNAAMRDLKADVSPFGRMDLVANRRSSVRIALRLSVKTQPENNQTVTPVASPALTAEPSDQDDGQAVFFEGLVPTGILTPQTSEDEDHAVEPPAKKQKLSFGRVTKPTSSAVKTRSRAKQEDDDEFQPDHLQKFKSDVVKTRVTQRSSTTNGYKVEEETTKEVRRVTTITRSKTRASSGSLKVSLSVPTLGKHLVKLTRQRRRSVIYDNMKYKIKFRWTPYFYHSSPTPQECFEVYSILNPWLLEVYGLTVAISSIDAKDGPAHGAKGMSVDALVKVFMSQATSNDNALSTHEILRKKFTYTVNGKEVVGAVPNYHKIRLLKPEELEPYLARAGLGGNRSKHIIAALNTVYAENEKRYDSPGGIELGNPKNAPDFVPGLLSLDFLGTTDMIKIFNWFCDLKNFAVKSAACLLEFNYGFPICAVDTHVLKIAAYLGWIPDECKHPDQAFNHLDARIPDYLKHAVHQLFWHHGQKCAPCKRKNNEKTEIGDVQECPIEHLIKKRWKVRNTGSSKRKRDSDTVVIKKERVTREIVSFKTFKSAEKAASKGYVEGKLSWDDNFGADEINAREKKRWEYVGVQKAMKATGQTLITTLVYRKKESVN